MSAKHYLFSTLIVALVALLLGSFLPFGAALGQEGSPPVVLPDTASPADPARADAAASTVFTYQGNLKKSGQAVNANCSFQFSLWDALTGGSQKGTTQTVTNAPVQTAVFTVQLDFGNQFTGDSRWLKTEVQCAAMAVIQPLPPASRSVPCPMRWGCCRGRLSPPAKLMSQP